MLFNAQYLPYQQTGFFSKMIVDYLDNAGPIQPFYANRPTIEGIQNTIAQKQNQKVDRNALVAVLKKQYNGIDVHNKVATNIDLLAQDDAFTICTAHQPNLFTGPLYFMYKILHAIKLADELSTQLGQYKFIPVYYMGSEDADFAELNHTYVGGKKLEWKKDQTGAVGRMDVDKALLQLITELEGQLTVEPYGEEVISMLRNSYAIGHNIQTATFKLINELFGKFGLIVLIPDNAELKTQMLPVFKDDLFNEVPSALAKQTSEAIEKEYNVQAHPREINLFYLKDNIRERIIRQGDDFIVHNTDIKFASSEIEKELENNPERFSPNVILRGLYQETILPNIAFIGGGGELAYWLQLKKIFEHYGVVYPILVLRNSFLVIEEKWQNIIGKYAITNEQLFKPQLQILNSIIENEGKSPKLNGELTKLEEVYSALDAMAGKTDMTLQPHVAALKVKALKGITNLEKKLWSAERKKQEAAQAQIAKLKQHLFPNNGLQERVENFSSMYAKWGSGFIDALYNHSLTLEQQFGLLFTES